VGTQTQDILSEPYTLGGIIAIVAIIVGVFMLRRRGWWAKPAAPPPAQPGQIQQPAGVKADVKFCINCGQQIPAATRFCMNCGTEQPQPSLTTEAIPELKGEKLKAGKRPVGVTLLAILEIIGGVFLLLGALVMLSVQALAASIVGALAIFIRPLLAAITAVLVICAVADLVTGWGLWKGKSWARLAAIILLALGIISPIIALLALSVALKLPAGAVWIMLQGSISSIIVGIVINALFIYILMRRGAKAFFKKQT
jgi:uncharacterized membrane protein (DUF2068 family)